MPHQNHKILLEDRCLIAQPTLIPFVGRSGAQLIQQIHYWTTTGSSGIKEDGQIWIYNTLDAWSAQMHLCKRQVQRIITKLKDLDILAVKNLSRNNIFKKYGYALNYVRLKTLVSPESDLRLNASTVQDTTSTSSGHNVQTYTKSTQQKESTLSEKVTWEDNEKEGNTNVTPHENVPNNSHEKLPIQLLAIWNQHLQEHIGPSSLTKKRAQWLVSAFKERFHSSLEKWRLFCEHIAKNAFFTGKTSSSFRVSLDWILRFDILQRLFEGDFGMPRSMGDDSVDSHPTQEEVKTSILSHAPTLEERIFRLGLIDKVGSAVYHSWFAATTYHFEQDVITLGVPSLFHQAYIEQNYLNAIQECCPHQIVVTVNR